MKYVSLILLALSLNLNAQVFDYGIKGGINYNFSGELEEFNNENLENTYTSRTLIGYHAGFWAKLNMGDLFLQPEIYYTKFNNNFDYSPDYELSTHKIDVPVVLGYSIFDPLYIYAGPDFQYILSEDFSIVNYDFNYDEITTGLHLGLGLDLGQVKLDVRWEKGLSEQTLEIINSEFVNENFQLDHRPNQILVSLFVKL